MGYEALMAQFSYSQSDLARVIGKSRPHIANTFRLLKLPDAVKAYLARRAHLERALRAPCSPMTIPSASRARSWKRA